MRQSTYWQTKQPEATFDLERSRELRSYWHHHDYCELFVPLAGAGRVIVGDFHGRFAAGEAFFVGPRLPHSFFGLSEAEIDETSAEFFVLTADLAVLAETIGSSEPLGRLLQGARRGLRFTGAPADRAGQLLLQAERADPLRRMARVLDVLALLSEARRAEPLCSDAYAGPLPQRDMQRIERALSFLHENFDRPLRLADVAGKVHISAVTLVRLFRRATGRPVGQYIHEMRIDKACRLLAKSNLPATAIAYKVGYQTLSSFNRMFRRLRRTTPTAYRQALRA